MARLILRVYIFVDGEILIILHELIFALVRYVIFMSNMKLVGIFFFFCVCVAKLLKMCQLNQYDLSLFVCLKKEHYFFCKQTVTKKPQQKFCMDLFLQIDE